jgi:hypothetical protein
MAPEARKSAAVKMFVELGPLDERAVRLDDSENVTCQAKEFAGSVNS